MTVMMVAARRRSNQALMSGTERANNRFIQKNQITCRLRRSALINFSVFVVNLQLPQAIYASAYTRQKRTHQQQPDLQR